MPPGNADARKEFNWVQELESREELQLPPPPKEEEDEASPPPEPPSAAEVAAQQLRDIGKPVMWALFYVGLVMGAQSYLG